MKIVCKRKEMLAAFGNVSGVIPARSPRPILSNAKIDATDNGTILMASDLEVGIRHRVIGVNVYDPGSAILPAAKLQSILATSSDEELQIETDGDQLIIRGRSATFKLPSEDPSLFPEVPNFEATAYHVVGAGDLRRMIRRCIVCTDVESTRYALGGVLVELADDSITMVGTDGRRLARMRAPAEAENGATPPVGTPVIPVKALKLIDRNLDDEELSVHIAVQGNSAVLLRTSDQSVTIYSRLVEGRFPAYGGVFPDASQATRIPLDVVTLRQAVSQAAIITSEESRGVRFCWGGGKLVLDSQAADVGSAKVEVEIVYDGPELDATLDPAYVVQALKTIDDDAMLEVNVIDHKNAILFKTQDGLDYIVMPLTTDR